MAATCAFAPTAAVDLYNNIGWQDGLRFNSTQFAIDSVKNRSGNAVGFSEAWQSQQVR